jgi:L-aminopeptidase/D-esterase-like protein
MIYNRNMNNTLTALKGIKVGHSTHLDKLTGCTFVLFDNPYPVAYKSYGGAPGTFNTDALQNGKSFFYGHGIFVAGGSNTGLMAGGEIMKTLIEKKIGWKSHNIINPNITGAIIYDLGTYIEQFNPIYGREAVENASYDPVQRGNFGAGTGAKVGGFSITKDLKRLNMKAGIGCSLINLKGGIKVTALSVVNSNGNIILPNGKILAGNRHDTSDFPFRTFEGVSDFLVRDESNTTITIIGINADLKTRENYEQIAHVASHGQIRAINPVNQSVDGDTVFVFSTEEIKDFLSPLGKIVRDNEWPKLAIDIIGQAAARAVQESIYDACYQADTVKFKDAYKGVIPSVKDYDK